MRLITQENPADRCLIDVAGKPGQTGGKAHQFLRTGSRQARELGHAS